MHFLCSTSSLLHNWYECHLRFTINYFVQKYAQHAVNTVYETREDNSMTIRLKSDAPPTIISPTRRLPFTLEESVGHELCKLLAADIIEPITASYISPIVVATKKDNSIRLCVDYRHIYSCTIPDQHPIPSVDELFSKVRNARFFSRIDLKAAYHQLDLHPDSRHLSDFITHVGLFQYKNSL